MFAADLPESLFPSAAATPGEKAASCPGGGAGELANRLATGARRDARPQGVSRRRDCRGSACAPAAGAGPEIRVARRRQAML
eukprot:13046490-Alexandrium_andersonii.AAC.1